MQRDKMMPASASSRNGTILVVDDDPNLRLLISSSLSRLGYRILVARNGEQAYRLCEHYQGSIDLLVTDMLMMKMDGSELAVKIQALRPAIHILIMSESHVMQGAFADKPDVAFLPKPFTVPELVSKLMSSCQKRVGSYSED